MTRRIFLPDQSILFYRSMLRIRRFEETVLEEFKRGVFSGTTHTSIGQEADAVGVISCLAENDVIVTNHRCHGHFLAYGGEPHSLFAEMMGKATGICGGRGGSQHIHWRNLYSNGVQGGIVPIAAGMALAEKERETGNIVTVFIGDGTFGEGIIYEAFNMASLWNLPLLIVVENNNIAQSTPASLALAGSICDRFHSFGISAQELDSSDVFEIAELSSQCISRVRNECRPAALVLHTCRFGPHSKGDDTRLEKDLQRMRSQRDPLTILSSRLNPPALELMKSEIDREINTAFHQALNDPEPVFARVER
jgi:TPP-dependent pyruvate/acetoin dehydrogenase alpha subunit